MACGVLFTLVVHLTAKHCYASLWKDHALYASLHLKGI